MALSEHEPITEFEDYLKGLLHDLQLEEDEKKELEEEWKQHLYDHYHSLRRKDYEKDESVRIAIEQFGDIEMLQKEVNDTYPSSTKKHVQKEIVIAVICLIASLIGPAILIGAHFRPYLILAPLQALVMAYVFHRFIIKKQTYWLFSVIGFAAIYLFFLQFLPQIEGTALTFELYLNYLFSLEWNRLTGLNGLFEYVTIHMLWYVIILVQLLSTNNFVPVWKRICNASFQYWAMLLIAIFLARFQSSAEWSVLLLNVFLLYAFFQQTISINCILIWKEKLTRLLTKQHLKD